MMRLSLLPVLACLLCSVPTLGFSADSYTLDPNHTNIDWRANHFGFSNPSGKFAKSIGTLQIDEASPAKSAVSLTVDTNSLVTGIAKFDEHLKSKDFLDTATYPTATFTSTKVTPTSQNTADVLGNLTLHGVTKPIILKTTLNKLDINPMTKKKTAGFSATTTIKRSLFGMTTAIPNVSDEVVITIEAEANLDGPAIAPSTTATQ